MAKAQLGFALSCEEHKPAALVQQSQRAEQVGFHFALISDHFHPWIDKQGEAPFVWTVIGAIAQATSTLQLGTGVTCPIIRYHPAILAQAAATSAAMMPGRFFFGIGSGENLNEHVVGQGWPATDVRLDMMKEALEAMRLLWQGGNQSFYGDHYTIENARIYTLPETPLEVYVAAVGEKAAKLAGQIGDGLINVAPDKEVVAIFDQNGGKGKPHYGQVAVCYAPTVEEGVKTAHEYWPLAGLKGQLSRELALPEFFEQATATVRPEDVEKAMVCGPDVEKHVEQIQKFVDAGYESICIHQIGPDQEGFFRFYEREILPRFS